VCNSSEKQGHWSSAGQWMNFVVVAAAVVTTFQQKLEGSTPLLLTAIADV
jgi:anti-sigma-K factor RskA